MKKTVIVLFTVVICSCASSPERSESTFKEKIALFQEAEQYYQQGLLAQAESRYRAMLKTNPNMYEAWLRLGNINVRTGQLEAATLAFEKCIAIAPERLKGWNNLALTHVIQATEVAREGLSVTDPNDPDDAKLQRLLERLIAINKI